MRYHISYFICLYLGHCQKTNLYLILNCTFQVLCEQWEQLTFFNFCSLDLFTYSVCPSCYNLRLVNKILQLTIHCFEPQTKGGFVNLEKQDFIYKITYTFNPMHTISTMSKKLPSLW